MFEKNGYNIKQINNIIAIKYTNLIIQIFRCL